VKIKDIISEGFFSGFKKGFLGGLKPKVFQDIEQAQQQGLQGLPPNIKDTALLAYQKFGDNPESKYKGAAGWLPPDVFKATADIQARHQGQEQEKEKSKKPKTGKKLSPAPTQDIAQKLKDIEKILPAKTQAQAPTPPQVKLPSGQYITNYGGNWYDEQGERITIPGDIERLNRMAAGPSGQAGMSATKNIPLDLPGYKGKRK